MKYVPLGEIIEDRYDLSKRYGLVELRNGMHRLTQKCRDNYDAISYLKYLQGSLEKPIRISPETKTAPKQPIIKTRLGVIQEVLDL
jgi:hypothetical protein